jgi:hypothetical protein
VINQHQLDGETMARPLPQALLRSRHAQLAALSAWLAIIQKQRDQLTLGQREAWNSHILALARCRDLLEHAGEGSGRVAPVAPTPTEVRDEIKVDRKKKEAAVEEHKEQLYNHMKDVQKAETQIWRLQEEEMEDLGIVNELLGECLEHLNKPLATTTPGGAVDLSDDGKAFAAKIKDVKEFFINELLAKLADREQKLLRFVDNTEQMLANQYKAAFTPEELTKLNEVHDKGSMRARGFAVRRSKAYQGFKEALIKMVAPVRNLAAKGPGSDEVQKAVLCLTRMKKAIEVLRENTHQTARMFRLEKAELEALTERFKPR